jgi:hypothetical protein
VAEDGRGESDEEKGRQDGGPHAQHPAAGAGRVDVRQHPVPQVRMRLVPRQAADGCARQGLPLSRECLAAQAHLGDSGLQGSQRGRVPGGPVAAQRPDSSAGTAQFIAAGREPRQEQPAAVIPAVSQPRPAQ